MLTTFAAKKLYAITKLHLLLLLCAGSLGYYLSQTVFPPALPATLELELRGPTGPYELFYNYAYSEDAEYSFSDRITVPFPTEPFRLELDSTELSQLIPTGKRLDAQSGKGGTPQLTGRISFPLPQAEIHQLRLDPPPGWSTLAISKLCLKPTSITTPPLCWTPQELKIGFRPRRDIADYEFKDNALFIKTTGPDPFFESGPAESQKIYRYLAVSNWWNSAFAFLISIIAMGLIIHLLNGERASKITERIVDCLTFGTVICFYLASTAVGHLTPPFQGPDENDHLARLIFAERSSELPCGQAPAPFATVWEKFSPLAGHPERRLESEQLFGSQSHLPEELGR